MRIAMQTTIITQIFNKISFLFKANFFPQSESNVYCPFLYVKYYNINSKRIAVDAVHM